MTRRRPGSLPHGVMLPVLRAGAADPHGDAARTETHQVGPAHIKAESADTDTAGDQRAHWRAVVRIPAGQDIRHRDQVRLPDGTLAQVTSRPESPRQPITGWRPYTLFTVET